MQFVFYFNKYFLYNPLASGVFMNKCNKFLTTVALGACGAGAAHATNFDLWYGDSNDSGFAILTTNSLGGGQYLVTGMYGELDGEVTHLVPGGPGVFDIPGYEVDNVLYYPPSPQFFDVYGLAFTDGNGYGNLWGNGDGTYSLFTNGTLSLGSSNAWAVAAETPSPAAILPFAAGLIALRRRRK
jgi:hypothetical protein